MIFAYRCSNEHLTHVEALVGQAPETNYCWCGAAGGRYFGPENVPQITADPFRSYHLSSRKEHAQARQQRYVAAPEDRPEAKRIERERGITFVGDDTSGMSAGARRGIEKHRDRVKSGEIVV